ncbi:hypothetical protein [Maribacter halichondriae]|uniref:hypothetical protein n=1 Tax=Maribacter halichondriae TaxID=2980554 RepID=UPI002358BA70|nr:hypothetical protein [Maribacter sp. Hal144]
MAFVMAKTYFQMGNYKRANELNEVGYAIKDSLDRIQSAEKIREIEGKYQTAQRDKKIRLLKAQNELAQQQKKNQQNFLLAGIGVTSLGLLFFFILYRNRQKTNQKLLEIDRLKNNFFTNISHEFRTPLTLISSPIQETLADPIYRKKGAVILKWPKEIRADYYRWSTNCWSFQKSIAVTVKYNWKKAKPRI